MYVHNERQTARIIVFSLKRHEKLGNSLAIRGKQLDACLSAATSTKLSFASGRSLDELISRICNITDRLEALENEENFRNYKNGPVGLQQRLRVSVSFVFRFQLVTSQCA